MSAVNVIIKRLFVFVVLPLLLLHLAGEAEARTKVRPPGFGAAQMEEITEQQGPSAAGPNSTENGNGVTEVDVVGIIYADEIGEKLIMPSTVFCDKERNETYVVQRGRVAVYGDDLFPASSIGLGRGAETALGVYVDKMGYVYVLQAALHDKPHRISVYNAAFFLERQIDLSAIEGISNPKNMAIGQNGDIYIAFSSGVRGLVVLDKDGNFSHWLRPMDLITDQQAILKSKEVSEQEEESVDGEEEEPDFDISELAPQLIPKSDDQVFREFEEPGLGPVQVTDVQVDSDGNIYILSIETSKVYIYNPQEEFLYSFGEKGGSTGKLSQPRKLVVDEKKKSIYIVDASKHAVLIYDLSGRFMHEFGGKGNRPGWFQYPSSIDTDKEGRLVVADKFNHRVQVLDVHFEYKFPLFQVPFVYDPNDIYQPQPIRATKHYGPGFDEGQAFMELPPDQEEIRLILEEAGDII